MKVKTMPNIQLCDLRVFRDEKEIFVDVLILRHCIFENMN